MVLIIKKDYIFISMNYDLFLTLHLIKITEAVAYKKTMAYVHCIFHGIDKFIFLI